MPYNLSKFDSEGHKLADLGTFANIASARQSMLDDSSTIDLPTEEPFYAPSCRVIEGWFIGRIEYHISQ